MREVVFLFGARTPITHGGTEMHDVRLSAVELASVSPATSNDGSGISRRNSDPRTRHRLILCFALLIIAASFFLRRGETDSLILWPQVELPPLCPSRSLFGVECPGCGLTRSFVALAAADLQESWRYHRLGWLLAIAVVGQIPYRLCALCKLRKSMAEHTWPNLFALFLVAMLTLNWLLRISGL
jgi:hypothetical protein